jgi:hypothetical protein
VEKFTVAAQPVGFTVTPDGDAVDALNAEAGQLPVGPVIPMTIGHPLAGSTHDDEAVGRAIAAVVVRVFVVGVEFNAEVGPVTVTVIDKVKFVPEPVKDALLTEQE